MLYWSTNNAVRLLPRFWCTHISFSPNVVIARIVTHYFWWIFMISIFRLFDGEFVFKCASQWTGMDLIFFICDTFFFSFWHILLIGIEINTRLARTNIKPRTQWMRLPTSFRSAINESSPSLCHAIPEEQKWNETKLRQKENELRLCTHTHTCADGIIAFPTVKMMTKVIPLQTKV